jgi:hypothetical protein
LAGRAFRQPLTLAAEATVAEAMAVATWAEATQAVILLAAGAAIATQDAAVIGADMAAATDMDMEGMAAAIHTTDVDTAPAALLVA